jgi:hypothetical protein
MEFKKYMEVFCYDLLMWFQEIDKKGKFPW